jgi:hypothetical protein
VLIDGVAIAGEDIVLATFQRARADEYEEIVDRCEGFLAEVRKEYDKAHFTYAELEENEVDYKKLADWFARITERDRFGAAGRDAAEAALARCEETLEQYASRVYQEEPEGH